MTALQAQVEKSKIEAQNRLICMCLCIFTFAHYSERFLLIGLIQDGLLYLNRKVVTIDPESSTSEELMKAIANSDGLGIAELFDKLVQAERVRIPIQVYHSCSYHANGNLV